MTDIEYEHATRARQRIESLTATLAENATELSKNIRLFSDTTLKAIEEFSGAVTEDAITTNSNLTRRMEEITQKMTHLADFMLGAIPKPMQGSTVRMLTPEEIAERKAADDREAEFQAESKPVVLGLGGKRGENEQASGD